MSSHTITMEMTISVMTVKLHLLVKLLQVVLTSFVFALLNMEVLKSSPVNDWASVF